MDAEKSSLLSRPDAVALPSNSDVTEDLSRGLLADSLARVFWACWAAVLGGRRTNEVEGDLVISGL